MDEVRADKELSLALCYFSIRNTLKVKEWAIEMLFSKGYKNNWTLTMDNWNKLKPFLPEDPEDLN